jgi:DNA polymerase-3 subunit alpha
VEGNWVDTVHFPPSIKQYRFAGSGCYELKGKVVEDQDFITLEVSYMKRLAMVDRENM